MAGALQPSVLPTLRAAMDACLKAQACLTRKKQPKCLIPTIYRCRYIHIDIDIDSDIDIDMDIDIDIDVNVGMYIDIEVHARCMYI